VPPGPPGNNPVNHPTSSSSNSPPGPPSGAPGTPPIRFPPKGFLQPAEHQKIDVIRIADLSPLLGIIYDNDDVDDENVNSLD